MEILSFEELKAVRGGVSATIGFLGGVSLGTGTSVTGPIRNPFPDKVKPIGLPAPARGPILNSFRRALVVALPKVVKKMGEGNFSAAR